MKKITIILALCAIALIAGCGKKKEEEVVITPTPAVTNPFEVTIAPTKAPTEDAVITREPIKGVPITDTPTPEPTATPEPTPTTKPTNTPKPTPTDEPAQESVASDYLPPSGYYTNGDEPAQESVASDYLPPSGYYTNGGGDEAVSMSISAIDAGSFSFSLSNGISGTANFEQSGSSSAVYRGNSTLYFDCSSHGVITVNGIDGGVAGNTFWNTDIHQAG